MGDGTAGELSFTRDTVGREKPGFTLGRHDRAALGQYLSGHRARSLSHRTWQEFRWRIAVTTAANGTVVKPISHELDNQVPTPAIAPGSVNRPACAANNYYERGAGPGGGSASSAVR
ncbi:hypothetical protein [Streptomyces canus]|uniref:hypothetical protein n=1 Tax=Streptomyces canus TaxID=58343 RepID=UPI003801F0A3